jgi:hypothetical protein
MNCGYMAWGSMACYLVLHIWLYNFIRSNYQMLYDELKWDGFFSTSTMTLDLLWLLLFGHWKYKSPGLSALCIGMVVCTGVFMVAITQTVCKGGFALW